MKKYLMQGIGAIALALLATGCNKETDLYTDADAVKHAEEVLGINIDPNQDWKMTNEVTATVDVDVDYGESYDVIIYENNPFVNNTGTVLGRTKVSSGSTATILFSVAKNINSVFVALKDKKGYTYLKTAPIVNNTITSSFVENGTSQAPATRGTKRASVAEEFTIPARTMPDLSAYINDAVAITAENNNTDPSNPVTHYLIPEGTTWEANIPRIQSGSGISVYVLGTLNINSEQRVNGGCVFIVGPTGTVNIASGTQLVTNANNEAGTVGSFYVYPGGKVQGEGALHFANGTGTYNYNGGSIDVGTINNNGGTLYNAGTIEADNMLGGAGLSIYENAGKMHIGQAAKGSGTANTRIHNNCWFECDGTLSCRNIVQGASAYIKAANLEMSGSEDGTGDKSYIYLKDNSLIDIPGAVAFNNVDIVGPTGDNYAYLQFGYAEGAWGAHGLTTAMNYTGGWGSPITTGAIQNNIRMSIDNADVDANDYTETPYEKLILLLNGACAGANNGNPNYSYNQSNIVGNGNAQLVQKGQYTIATVSASECSPGITPQTPTEITNEGKVFCYAFEDTYNGDYDMNDVVIKTQLVEGTTDQLKVTLCATGASFSLYCGYTYTDAYGDKVDVNLFGGLEVHQFLSKSNNGRTRPSATTQSNGNKFVNTNTEDNEKFIEVDATLDQYSEIITIPEGYTAGTMDIWIKSPQGDSEGKIHIAKQGQDPHGVVIPFDWKWPKEYVNIKTAYPDFETFAADVTNQAAKEWYNNLPDASKVYTPSGNTSGK